MESLYQLLRTKRPTRSPDFCFRVAAELLKSHHIIFTPDAHQNIIVTTDSAATTAFTAHTDTVESREGFNELLFLGNTVSVKGGGILGADDGAGMWLLLQMILAKVPGIFIFFSQEEQGRIGSQAYRMPRHVRKVVSFDRKDTTNLITHQSGQRGCSDTFADALISQLHTPAPFVKDPTGSFTDSYSFIDSIPECVNLSVGYEDAHSSREKLDLAFLGELRDAVIEVDWEALPVARATSGDTAS